MLKEMYIVKLAGV